MELRGTLQSFQPSEILQFLTHAGKTGILRVHDDSDTKLLGFRAGQLCYAVHQRQLPHLREIILHRNLATPEQLSGSPDEQQRWDDAVSRALARRRLVSSQRSDGERWLAKIHASSKDARLGRVLVAQGRLSDHDLVAATDPSAVPDNLLAAIVRGAGLVEPEALTDARSGESEERSTLDCLLGKGLLTRAQVEDAVSRISDESLAELLVLHGTLSRAEARHWLARLNALRGRTLPTIRVGEYLLAKGRVTQNQLERALWDQLVKNRRLGEILVEQGVISASELTATMEEIGALRADFGPLFPLRQKLAQHGIGPDDVTAAIADCETTELPLANALVETGKIADGPMQQAVQAVLIEEICDLLLWSDASFEFLEGFALEDAVSHADYRHVHDYSFEIQSLLLEAHSLLDELRRTAFADLHPCTVLIAALPDDEHAEAGEVQPGSRPDIVCSVNGRRSLREVCRVLPGSRLSHLRLFAELLDEGHVRPLTREEAFFVGQEALSRRHAGEAIVLFEHALDAPGLEPSGARLRRALAEAQWACDKRLGVRLRLATKRFIAAMTETPWCAALLRRSRESSGLRRVGTWLGSALGRARSAIRRTGRLADRAVLRTRLRTEEFLIRIGLDRRLWALKARTSEWWTRIPGTRHLSFSKGVAYAGMLTVVALAALNFGAPSVPAPAAPPPPSGGTPVAPTTPNHVVPIAERAALSRFVAGAPIDVAPAVHAGHVYVAVRDGTIRSLSSSPVLEVRWEHRVGEFGDVLSAPVIADGMVFVCNVRGTVFAFSLDGVLLWQRNLARIEPIAPTPLLTTEGELAGIAVVSRESVHVLAPEDGTSQYQLKTGNRVLAAPVGDAEMLVVGSGDNHIYAAAWRRAELVWEHEETDDITAMVVCDHKLVFATRNGFFAALDGASGERLWKRSLTRDALESIGVLAPGSVFLRMADRTFEIVDSGTGKTISLFVPDPRVDVARLCFDAMNRLFVSATGHLGELDVGGSIVWRGTDPVGDVAGWCPGDSFVAVTTREGEVALYARGAEGGQ